MMSDFVIITLSWILLTSLSLVSLPLLGIGLKKLAPDSGWAWGRVVGWLLVSIPVWFLAHVGIPINTTAGIWIVYLLLLALSAWIFHRNKPELIALWRKAKNLIIAEELLFAAGFIFLSIVRGYQPDINGLEKFMDAGLMVSYLHSPTLPIADMWLAGYDFNYYTFGHFLGAVATQIIQQPIAISYNILLGFIMGLTLIQSFGILSWLLKSLKNNAHRIIASSVGALLVTIGGNTQNLWFFLTNGTFKGFWYPDSTRFIPFTIHEFPSYSFIVSDLHAHVWSMVLVLLIIPLIFAWGEMVLSFNKKDAIGFSQKSVLIFAGMIGVLLGLIASTSTWDTMIYGPLLGLVGVAILIKTQGKGFIILVQSAIVVVISAAIAASPWLLNFQSISEGIRLVKERTELWRILVLWVGMLTASIAATWLSISKIKSSDKPQYWQIIVMSLLAWTLLILPELIFFKDIYPGHPRANTMFKFTFQAFIIMQLVTGWLLGQLINGLKLNGESLLSWSSLRKLSPLLLLGVYIVGISIYPYFGYRDYYGLKQYKGLDGLNWIALQYPNDYAGMVWLNRYVSGRPVILEAVGESYTTFSRVSSFTGMVTVLGWPVHEWLWRGSFDIPGRRTEEVKNMYNLPLSAESLQKFREYQVRYIFIGDKEREAYPDLSLEELKSLGPVVFQSGKTIIIQLGESVITNKNSGPIEFR